MNRFSPLVEWNFIGDFPRFLQDMRDLQPPVLIGINDSNDFTYSRQVHDASPSTQIYHRKVNQFENRPWLVYGTAGDMLNDLRANAPDWLGFYLFNEFDMSGGDETKRVIDWAERCMNYTLNSPLPHRLIVLNNSVGTWRREGMHLFKEVFRLAGEHPELFKLGTHEYAQNNPAIDTSSPSNPHSAYDLLDAAKVQKDKWVTPPDFVAYSDTNDWIGRYLWVNEYCQANGIPIPRKVISEWGCDYMGDLPADLLLGLQSMNGGVQPRGFTSLERYYQTVYGQPVETMVFHFYEHAERIYTEDVEAICPFIFSHNGEWQAYNLLNMRTLMANVIARKRSEDVIVFPPETDPRWINVELFPYGTEGVFLRSGPSKENSILHTIRERTPAKVLSDANMEESAQNWILFRVGSNIGYIRSDVIGVDFFLDEPQPPVQPPQQALALLGRLQVLFDATTLNMSEMATKIDELRNVLESGQS